MTGIRIGPDPNSASELQRIAMLDAKSYKAQLTNFISQLAMLTHQFQARGARPIEFDLGETVAQRISEEDGALSEMLNDLDQYAVPELTAVPERPNLPPIDTSPYDPGDVTIKLDIPGAPQIQPPQPPLAFRGLAPQDVPVIAPAIIAKRVNITLPEIPKFENIVVPTILDVELPAFVEFARDADDLTIPPISFEFEETEYISPLRESLIEALTKDFKRDGSMNAYGIDIEDEKALWAREVDRENKNMVAAFAEAGRASAARGFMLPPGAMMAQLAAAQAAALGASSSASRDIYLKRADLFVANRRWTIEQLTEWEKLSLSTHLTIVSRAYDVAKSTVELAISAYNVRVARFKAKLEEYQTNTQAYEAHVRGELARLETQKLKLEVTKTEADIQKRKVDLYSAQLVGVKSLVDVYQADVAAAKSVVEQEALKVQVFKTRVEAYSEQVKAHGLQNQVYEAQIKGNTSLIEVYKAKIQAQEAVAQMASVQANVISSKQGVHAATLQGQIAAAKGVAEVYQMQAGGVAAKNQAATTIASAKIDALKAFASISKERADLRIAEFDAEVRKATTLAQLDMEDMKNIGGLQSEALAKAADIEMRAMQAAMNQVISIASTIAGSA